MQTCGQGHENDASDKFCTECSYPLDIPIDEKISFLKKQINGKIDHEMIDGDVGILYLQHAKNYSIDLSLIFPNLSNLTIDGAQLASSQIIFNLKHLRYLTLYLHPRLGKVKLTSEDLDNMPNSITSLTITVDSDLVDRTVVDIAEDLLMYFPNLQNLYIYCNPSNLRFLAKGHDLLGMIEFMGEGFDFEGRIANFPSLTSIVVDFHVRIIDIELRNLPNLDFLSVTLSSVDNPVSIESSNVDYQLLISYNF